MVRRYLVPFRAHRLSHVLTDVLVIGAGVAGLRAAVEAAKHGDVLLISKAQLSESNTYYSQGGLAGVMRPGDSFESHIRDTITTAGGIGNMAAMETVVRETPARIQELIEWGANFDREIGGELSFGLEGGHSFARIVHALGDATGRELVNCLTRIARGHEQIQPMEHTFILDLITSDHKCLGALAYHKDRGLFMILARQTILASGGAGMLYRETTNPAVATADGHAMAYRAGAVLRDMEMVQFHPTTIYIAGASRALVSEAVRGEGAKLIDKAGRRFMPDYHALAELAPRDIVSRSILTQMAKTRTTNVFLDCRHMSEDAFKARFPNIYQVLKSFNINPATTPIPVHPSAHYMIGGVSTDLSGRSNIDNLYVIGEASNTGLHGANRLASNSLIEALVFGKRSGEDAGAHLHNGNADLHVPKLVETVEPSDRTELDTQDVRSSLRALMWRNAGIERVGPRLEESLEIINFWSHYVLDKTFHEPSGWELQNMLTVAALIARSALAREESRGVHFRVDFPARDDAHWQKHLDYPPQAETPVKAEVEEPVPA